MSASTNTAVEIPRNDNTTIGAWLTETHPRLDSPLRMDWGEFYSHRKPHPVNTNVDKKVKRAGWSPQFFEK